MRNLRVFFDGVQKDVESVIIRNLKAIGEYGVGYARDKGAYTDRTGNLRSSIGYIIVKEGKEIAQGGFNPSENAGTDGEIGALDGYAFAKELVADFIDGYTLIMVAGMFYAEYVEAKYYYSVLKTKTTVTKESYDVLTETEIEVREFARNLFEETAKQMNNG